LSTSIVLLRSLDEKNRYDGPLIAAHRRLDIRHGPARHGVMPRAWQLWLSCGGTGEIPVFQTIIPALLQCTFSTAACRFRLTPKGTEAPH
jgi:hypothetical protein